MNEDYKDSESVTGTDLSLEREQVYYPIQDVPVIDSRRQGGSGQHAATPSFLRRFGPLGLVLLFVFGKMKYLLLILKVGKFKTFITMTWSNLIYYSSVFGQ